jgi:uncharacterized protein
MKSLARLLAIAVVLGLIGGCRSPSPRLHTLSALTPEPSMIYAENAMTLVAVGPVTLADYLDHPELTVRTGPNEISRSDLDRWAITLGREVDRAATANLAALLDSDTIKVMPWMEAASPDFRIQIYIHRFEREPDGRIALHGDWTLFGPGRTGITSTGTANLTTPAPSPAGAEIAAAMSTALAEMCRQIAQAVEKEMFIFHLQRLL